MRIWRDFLDFGLKYFSVFLLLRTFFSPWRRYHYEYARRLDIGQWFETLTFNMMSRCIGAIMRLFLIGFGIGGEILIFLAGTILLVTWFILPFLIPAGLFMGLKLIL